MFFICSYLFVSLYIHNEMFPDVFPKVSPFHWASFESTLGPHLRGIQDLAITAKVLLKERFVDVSPNVTSWGKPAGFPTWKTRSCSGKFLHEKSLLLLHLPALFI